MCDSDTRSLSYTQCTNTCTTLLDQPSMGVFGKYEIKRSENGIKKTLKMLE